MMQRPHGTVRVSIHSTARVPQDVRRRIARWARMLAIAAVTPSMLIAPRAARPSGTEPARPNIVVVFTDDQGYADVGCYGATTFATPHLDRMASEGMRFTSFYVAQAVCGASRAALLTGCYPNRIGMLGAPSHAAKHGIHADEDLLPELVREQGYATAMFGKWHLGHREPFLPLQHGFETYFGLPYSNDMWPFHPETPRAYPPLPLIENNTTIATNPDQNRLTTWYTERAVAFIRKHRDRPFFLYIAHNMPHVPLHASDAFRGKSPQGLYGDVIQEIDGSLGQLLKTLRDEQIDDRTLVIFTSDNGPWLSYGNHAGNAGPLREGKGTTWEGGVRVPCIMRWPGRIPAGAVCDKIAATIDLVPTLSRIAGARSPKRPIDGVDIGSLLWANEPDKSPRDSYYYYWGRELQAIRSGPWKLHFPHTYRSLTGQPGRDGKPGGYSQQSCGLELYNLIDDIGERTDVAAKHDDVVKHLETLAEQAREELGDALGKRTGSGTREPGRVTEP